MLQRLSSKVKSKRPSSPISTDSKKDRQSPALDSARIVFQLASNLGSGAFNVPGLQAAGLIGVQIIDIVKKARSNKQDAEDLVTRISELMQPILDALQNQSARDIDPGLKADIERFQQDLGKIRDVLSEQNGRGRFSRVVNSAGDGEGIVKCKEMVDHSFKRFQIYTSISLRLNAADLHDTVGQAPPTTGYIPSQPVAPEIFFGREDTVGIIVRLFDRQTSCRIALMGSGGIGKTSAGLHIFHHPDIKHRFEPHQYFVACDAITTSDALAIMILQVMGARIVNSESPNTTLHRVLMTLPPALIFLDNFETLWDSDSSKRGVEDLLSKIGASPNVSLMVTTRIKELPNNISWTHEAEITPLSPKAARQTYLAIDTSREYMDDASMKTLDDLLKELDYVALAIRLLATVGKGYSPAYLLRQWKEERTELLDLRKDRQSSIAVSISLSLSQLKITNNPEALQLLGVLSLLPDGLSNWTEHISRIGHGFTGVHRLARILLQTSLCFLHGTTLKVLSPIRHYILAHNPAATHYVEDLEHYYWDLIRDQATTDIGPKFPEVRKVVDPEMGNIRSLIRNAIKDHPSIVVIEVTIGLSWYFSRTVPSTALLNEVGESSKLLGNTSVEARRLEVLAQNLHVQSRYAKASECLREARDKFAEIGDAPGAARCSQLLGDILYLERNFIEATVVLQGARDKFIEIGDVLRAAQCSGRLCDLLYSQNRYEEATAALKQAQSKFLEIDNVLGAAECSHTLCVILYMQGQYDEAIAVQKEARTKLLEIGHVVGAARCLQTLGQIRTSQGKYAEASIILSETREQFLKAGTRLDAAQCLQALGNNLRFEEKYVEAKELLIKARDEYSDIGESDGVEQCDHSLAEVDAAFSKEARGGSSDEAR